MVLIQNAAFVGVVLFWGLMNEVFFIGPESRQSAYLNGFICALLGIAFFFPRLFRKFDDLADDLDIGFSLFIVYNLIPLFIQQRSMFGAFLAAEMALAIVVARNLLARRPRPLTLSARDRLTYGAILGFFSLLFIGRGLTFIVAYFRGGSMTNETAVAVADVILCSVWLVAAIGLFLDKKTGATLVLPVFLHACLLFASLVAYMLIAPLAFGTEADWPGFAAVLAMSLCFAVPAMRLIGTVAAAPAERE